MPFAVSGKDRKGKSGIFRRPDNWDKKDDKVSSIVKNAIAPINPKKSKVLQGSVIYVALEVAVSKLLRTIMRADNKTIAELAAVHTVSLGLMGGTGAAITNPQETVVPYGTKSVKQHIKQGAKGIPALFLAQYVYNTFFYGFTLSHFTMKDALIMAAAKVLTRPIASKLYPRAKFIQNGLDAQQLLEECQMKASNFRRIQADDLYVKPVVGAQAMDQEEF